MPVAKYIFVIIILLLSAPTANSEQRTHVCDSLRAELHYAYSAADSISILYDLFDASPRKERRAYGFMLYEVATKANATAERLDILRQLANAYPGNDSIQAWLEREASSISKSDEQQETLTFIRLTRISTQATYTSERDRQQKLHKILHQMAENPSGDIYDQIVRQFTVCIYLGRDTQGGLLAEYFGKLDNLIEQAPHPLSSIRSLFYTQAAIVYSNNRIHLKAIEADRKLLEIIDSLSVKYAQAGRKFRSYDTSKYICYRRMLSNYPALTKEEADDYYDKVLALAERDSDIKTSLKERPEATIYYLMKHKRYAEAIPLIKKLLQTQENTRSRLYLMKMLKEAATATGDKATLLDVALDYNNVLEEYIALKATERYRELQIIYDINKLKIRNDELELYRQKATAESHRSLIIAGFVIVILLIILVITLSLLFRRSRKLSEEIRQANEDLLAERDNLQRTQADLIAARDQARIAANQKTDFIGDISHEINTPVSAIVEYTQIIVDCVDDEKRRYLDRFANNVKLNAQLLQTLVNDIMDLASLDNSTMTVNRKPTSLHAMCIMALDNIRPQVKPNVSLSFADENRPDMTVNTDAQRVAMVLTNLLSNAAKFTEKGSITLNYELSDDNSAVTFAVTDTGIGIPEDKADLIFQRFEKLSKFTQGLGLGLAVCRLVAKLLNGDVRLDTTYTSGARFYFTIPIRPL